MKKKKKSIVDAYQILSPTPRDSDASWGGRAGGAGEGLGLRDLSFYKHPGISVAGVSVPHFEKHCSRGV